MRAFRRALARHHAACEKELGDHGKPARCPVVFEITRTASGEAGAGQGKKR